MVIGEAPGKNEDELGKPFVGAAGKRLNEALDEAGLARPGLYVTNIYKARPPGNREPTAEEVNAHLHFLLEEFNDVNPEYVLLLGNTPLKVFTGTGGITARHGSRIIPGLGFSNSDIFFYCTFHPSATQYNPNLKEDFFRDVKIFAKIAKGTYSL
jgi:DNA polymerase